VTPRLVALVRKELIRPAKAQFPGEDGFRFRHLLIRDTAYQALPKSTRAELHERFAAWLEERGRRFVELDELVGYHLEQAARYKAELGQAEPALAEQAGERLARAGRRALGRGDERAAAALLERALELTRAMRFDAVLEIDLARAHRYTAQAAAIAERAVGRAHAAHDRAGEALARAVAAHYRSQHSPELGFDEVETLARAALPLLEQVADHAALVHVWDVLGLGVANNLGRFEEHAHAAEQALHHARLAGYRPGELFHLDYALACGPRPADEALRKLDRELPEAPHPRLLLTRGWLLAMLARFDEATAVANPALERWHEFTGGEDGRWMLAEIAKLAGDDEGAAQHLRRFCTWLEEHGQHNFLSTFAPSLGRSLCALERHDEALHWAQLGRELGDENDVATQMLWRQVQAVVGARRGEHAQAEALAREAVAISERSDSLNEQGDALCDLAEVLRSAGSAEEARAALTRALERYERKRNLAMAERIRGRLAEPQPAAAPAERT
jgi:tetratricopeptide (TPR) repeat protein